MIPEQNFEVGSVSKRRFFQTLMFSLLLILSCISSALVLIAIVAVKLSTRTHHHAIVFDAGSTHTQMIVFSWLSDKSDGAFDTAWVKQVYSHDTHVGISSLAYRGNDLYERVRSYFSQILDKADAIIPAQERSKTNVLLGATAGMRLLEQENHEMCSNLLKEIQSYIVNKYSGSCDNGNPFSIHHLRLNSNLLNTTATEVSRGYKVLNQNDIRILSGKEEALYGWISANILMSKINPRSRRCTPVGIADLGGASMQVAFEQKENGYSSKSKTTRITLYGTTFEVFGASFLCWGKEQSHYRYLGLLVRLSNIDSTANGQYADPCGVRGFTYTQTAKEVFDHSCSINGGDLDRRQLLTFIGSGDSDACGRLTEQLFVEANNIRVSKDDTGYFDLDQVKEMVVDESDRQNFVLFSGFYHVWKALKEPIGWQDFHYRLQSVCSFNIDKWRAQSMNDSVSFN
ncbi:hypothetical protein ACOME3_008361 [Neoechinorhynchus agilis]